MDVPKIRLLKAAGSRVENGPACVDSPRRKRCGTSA